MRHVRRTRVVEIYNGIGSAGLGYGLSYGVNVLEDNQGPGSSFQNGMVQTSAYSFPSAKKIQREVIGPDVGSNNIPCRMLPLGQPINCTRSIVLY